MDLIGWLYDTKTKETISAVHPKDINGVLKDIGYLEEIEKDIVRCEVCGGSVTENNISKIIPKTGSGESESYKFRCDRLKCFLSHNPDQTAQQEFKELNEDIQESKENLLGRNND